MKIKVIIGLVLLLIGGVLLWRLDVVAQERDDAEKLASDWKDTAEALSETLATEREEALLTEGVMQNYRSRVRELESQETEVTREVIRYVANPDIPECHIDVQWVRIYNSSGGVRVPEAAKGASRIDGTSGGVYTTKSVLGTIKENNVHCSEDKAKVKGLQEFIARLYSSRGESYTY